MFLLNRQVRSHTRTLGQAHLDEPGWKQLNGRLSPVIQARTFFFFLYEVIEVLGSNCIRVIND